MRLMVSGAQASRSGWWVSSGSCQPGLWSSDGLTGPEGPFPGGLAHEAVGRRPPFLTEGPSPRGCLRVGTTQGCSPGVGDPGRGREQEAAVPFVTSSWRSVSVTSVTFYWSDPNQSIQTQGKGLSGTPCGRSLSRGPHRQLHPLGRTEPRSDRFLPVSVSPARTAACLAHGGHPAGSRGPSQPIPVCPGPAGLHGRRLTLRGTGREGQWTSACTTCPRHKH